MTRIKKRRSGKKRSIDRKKVSAGRRGGRAATKETVVREKKESSKAEQPKNEPARKKTTEPVLQKGKTRPAGARRVAAAKHIAAVAGTKGSKKKPAVPGKETAPKKKQGSGFAPWNKNKFKKKGKEAE